MADSFLDRRRSGVLLHPTCLPSRCGIGDLGPAAYTFLEYLAGARQTLWQVLPLGPTGLGDSPYSSPSAFAGNPLLIALEPLVQCGILCEADLAPLADLPDDHVEFVSLITLKRAILETAFERGRDRLHDRVEEFRRAHTEWLDDYALFAAIKDELQVGWTEWAPALRGRDPEALGVARERLSHRVAFHTFCQFLFFDQWSALRARAAELGIGIVGDIPVFVAHDSADVWAHQHLFKLNPDGQPIAVAGVPPDYFSATGQLWGNPLYDWDAMARDGYAWWIARFRHIGEEVDVVRIDHFRGFEAAWEVPAGEYTAINGQWVRGPGEALFGAVQESLGRLPVIAEDLGLITEEVRALLRATGFPGMKVLQFAFGGEPDNPYLPHNYVDPNCVVYTGTHDNDTTRGWFATLDEPTRMRVLRYIGASSRHVGASGGHVASAGGHVAAAGGHVTDDLMRLALSSIARTAIVPLQDVLDLGSEARINIPGAPEGNWAWRFRPDQLDPSRADCLAELTTIYGRDR